MRNIILHERCLPDQTDCDIVINKKGEWGINLVPQATTGVLGGMGDWQISGDNRDTLNNRIQNRTNLDGTETDVSGETFRQRKRRRKLEEKEGKRCRDTHQIEKADPIIQEAMSLTGIQCLLSIRPMA